MVFFYCLIQGGVCFIFLILLCDSGTCMLFYCLIQGCVCLFFYCLIQRCVCFVVFLLLLHSGGHMWVLFRDVYVFLLLDSGVCMFKNIFYCFIQGCDLSGL